MFDCVVCYCCRIFFEVTLYLLVDHIAFECMNHSCDSKDKQSVLILECIVLFPVCAVIYMNHTPYLLFVMTCFTLFYAIFLPDFRSYWEKFVVLWTEFLIHEEQQRIERGETNRVSPELTERVVLTIGNPGYQTRGPNGAQRHLDNGRSGLGTGIGGMSRVNNLQYGRGVMSNPSDLASGVDASRRNLGNANVNSYDSDENGVTAAPLQSAPSVLPAGGRSYGGVDALRRVVDTLSGVNEMGSNSDNMDHNKPPKQGVFSKLLDFLTPSSFLNGSRPPGLTNPNAVCFMNCILQTLSRTPGLVGYINNAVAGGALNTVDPKGLPFLRELFNVLRVLAKPEDTESRGQLRFYGDNIETVRLRKTISVLYSLVVDPDSGQKQIQQDAGEFLTWLMDWLDEILVTQSHIQTTQESLRSLREKLDNPSDAEIESKRDQCRHQISQANGRNSQTYLWAASSLSDLEWLIYKKTKISVISDIFQGQEVSALFCNSCEHISISFNQFSVILLPIPTDVSGVVQIDNCFRQLLTVSFLSGPNGRACEICTSRAQRSAYHTSGNVDTSTPNGPVSRRPNLDFLSPIAPAEHVQPRLSTPGPVQPSLTDGQKQMSYRHLPDCLIVQLLRFDSSMKKIFKRVRVSTDPIDLSFLDCVRVGPLEPRVYTLYGVCLHMGASNMESGHYTSYSLAEDGRWYYFNDNYVSRVENINQELEEEKKQQSIYLLFYKRIARH